MEPNELTFFPNLASEKWSHETDIKVRNELMHAHITYIKLPSYMETDVKTDIIGILQNFVFYRAHDYWVCKGKIPGKLAIALSEDCSDLHIQTNIQLDKEMSRRKLERPGAHISRCSIYTQEGLMQLAKMITENISETSFINNFKSQA